LVSENVLEAANLLLVPLIPATLSLRTFEQLLGFVDAFSGHRPSVRAFFSMLDRRKRMHADIMRELPRLSDSVFAASCHRRLMSREWGSPANPWVSPSRAGGRPRLTNGCGRNAGPSSARCPARPVSRSFHFGDQGQVIVSAGADEGPDGLDATHAPALADVGRRSRLCGDPHDSVTGAQHQPDDGRRDPVETIRTVKLYLEDMSAGPGIFRARLGSETGNVELSYAGHRRR
jgi:hypothetical protein